VFGSPVVTHPVCNLDLQRRIAEAKRETALRSFRRGRRGRWFRRGTRPHTIDAKVLSPTGEDVGQAFRF
jgi:hypothetical protein